MIIHNLHVQNFRNLSNQELFFSSSTNLIHGMNGTGKTSILESIYILGFGKSFLGARPPDLVRFNSSFFRIEASISHSRGNAKLGCYYDQQSTFFLDQKKIGISEISEYLFPIFFSSHTYIFHLDYRTYFRKLIDRFIYGVNHLYLHYLLRYNQNLKQKIHILRKSAYLPQEQELDSWNRGLAENGNQIVKNRIFFCKQINEEVKRVTNGDISLRYISPYSAVEDPSESILFYDFCHVKDREMKARKSIIGPHRDYFEVWVGDQRLNLFSSGEKKKYLLLFYIAYIELFKKVKNDYPVFLLDDWDAAIDDQNLEFLNNSFPDMQVIATSVAPKGRFLQYITLKKEN